MHALQQRRGALVPPQPPARHACRHLLGPCQPHGLAPLQSAGACGKDGAPGDLLPGGPLQRRQRQRRAARGGGAQLQVGGASGLGPSRLNRGAEQASHDAEPWFERPAVLPRLYDAPRSRTSLLWEMRPLANAQLVGAE